MATLILGIIVIFGGFLIGQLKLYSLITIFNTESDRRKSKYKAEQLGKAIAILLYFLGATFLTEALLTKENISIINILRVIRVSSIIFFLLEIRKDKYKK